MNITRRDAIRGATAALAGTGLAIAANALSPASGHASEPGDAFVDSETCGLTGLSLAAVHIERAIAAMAGVEFGKWSVKIHSGNAKQSWSFHQEGNLVLRAISRHRRAEDATKAALDARDEIEASLNANPRYEEYPHVAIGKLVLGTNAPDATIIVRSVEDIDRYARQWDAGAATLYRNTVDIDSFRAAFAEKRKQLQRKIARKKRLERAAGLPEAQKLLEAAYTAEERTVVEIMLAPALTPSERAEKAAYMKGRFCFGPHYWDTDALLAALASQVVA